MTPISCILFKYPIVISVIIFTIQRRKLQRHIRFLFTDTVDQADDGIGTSDDETNSNSSSTGPNTQETSEESSSSPNMGQSRRVIKLDLAAISQLLAFDEVTFPQIQGQSKLNENNVLLLASFQCFTVFVSYQNDNSSSLLAENDSSISLECSFK